MVNGYEPYDLTGQLDFWSDKDLVDYILDSETMMGLEKYQVVRLAQELAERFPTDDGEDDYSELDEEEEAQEVYNRRKFTGRERN